MRRPISEGAASVQQVKDKKAAANRAKLARLAAPGTGGGPGASTSRQNVATPTASRTGGGSAGPAHRQVVTVHRQVATASPHATRSRSFVAALTEGPVAPPATAVQQAPADPTGSSQLAVDNKVAESLQRRREKGVRIQSAPSTSSKRQRAALESLGGRPMWVETGEKPNTVDPVGDSEGNEKNWVVGSWSAGRGESQRPHIRQHDAHLSISILALISRRLERCAAAEGTRVLFV